MVDPIFQQTQRHLNDFFRFESALKATRIVANQTSVHLSEQTVTSTFAARKSIFF